MLSIVDPVAIKTSSKDNLVPSGISKEELFEVDLKGNFLTVPTILEEITGFSKEELDLLSLHNVTFTEDRQRVVGSIGSIKAGAPLIVSEIEVFSESKGSHPVELILLPLTNEGEIYGMWGAIKDIAQRKKLEKELKDVKGMQDASQRFLTDFVTLLTREIRQPMTTILLTLEMLDSGSFGEMNKVQGQKVAQLIEIIDKLMITLNEALDMSRNIDEEIQLDRKAVPLDPLIKEIIATRRARLKDQDIKVMTNFPEGKVKAEVDRKAFSEVISTLLDRAIDASPRGSQVIMDIEERDKDVLISISDSGEGMPENELENLFDKLHLDPERESKSLTEGMNLYITKRIIDRHGGRIWCESFVGLGSTYLVIVPKKNGKEA